MLNLPGTNNNGIPAKLRFSYDYNDCHDIESNELPHLHDGLGPVRSSESERSEHGRNKEEGNDGIDV